MDNLQVFELPDPHLHTTPGLQPPDATDSLSDQIDKLLRTYYLVVRALATGHNPSPISGHGRPRLPRELIYMICSFAGFGLPNEAASMVTDKPIFVSSRDPTRVSKRWLCTERLTRKELKNIVAAQIITESHDQGWADRRDIWWRSWFSLRISGRDEHSLNRNVDREREWKSHSNQLADYTTRRLYGLLFDSSHEIWKYLDEGDRLEVMVHAQFRGWENHGERGILRIFTRWCPSEEFLNIVCGVSIPRITIAPPAESQTPHIPPPINVSFAASAKLDSIHLRDGHVLVAKLLKNGEWNDTSFELDNCLGNLDGKFGWGSKGFSASAKNTRLDVSHAPAMVLLGSMLRKEDGSYDWDIINLNECVVNVDGEFKLAPSKYHTSRDYPGLSKAAYH
ncbi:cyanovirin-N [Rhizoctonia solani]|uniref:Cyanovirin-N n=1 Tax=Rhizoctonia solani TaxID=456999 RepID=A0A8H8NS98_9AGAM|nr:cyanovirin-N [Rhizoctonia solani]QRW17423.1 cyanovirin-N [Rhizoctonia solani]